jgi:hypothetical protein
MELGQGPNWGYSAKKKEGFYTPWIKNIIIIIQIVILRIVTPCSLVGYDLTEQAIVALIFRTHILDVLQSNIALDEAYIDLSFL